MEQKVSFTGEYITLGQLVKMLSLVDTGGQVKPFLEDTAIEVNGESENRRGRKLRHGDIINIDGHGQFRLE